MNQQRRTYYLQQLGIIQYQQRASVAQIAAEPEFIPELIEESPVSKPVEREVATEIATEPVPEPSESLVPNIDVSQREPVLKDNRLLDWQALQTAVSQCRSCGLHQTRTQTVFGIGDQQARLMIIGEAPGAEEDKQGQPFVGSAGLLLTAMLKAIGLSRQQVFIANILKCRPPGNRNPGVKEVAACRDFIENQIALVEPELILLSGGVAAHALLETDEAVGRLRGKSHVFGEKNIPVVVTYHPAYLLRRPEEKAKVWTDLQLVCTKLNV